MSKIVVVRDGKLSGNGSDRYVIVDEETGEILDDAQGYGYKSKKKAYAAYAYMTRDKKKDKERERQRKHIEAWMKEHKEFVSLMEDVEFELAKGSWGPEYQFNTDMVKKMLKRNGLEPDFTAYELLKVYRKR